MYEAGCREAPNCVWVADTKNADGSPATPHCQKKGASNAAKPAAATAGGTCQGLYEAGCRETPGCVWIADTKNADGSVATPRCQKKAATVTKPKPPPAAAEPAAAAAAAPQGAPAAPAVAPAPAAPAAKPAAPPAVAAPAPPAKQVAPKPAVQAPPPASDPAAEEGIPAPAEQ
jgi:2-oxoglutarate dehydrogenase E2 component (dihydrolipoamide succinyltransferase)